MNKIIKVCMLLIIINVSFLCSNKVLAATLMSVDASIENQTINVGDEVVLHLSTKDTNEIGEGVNAYITIIEFDTAQFEFLKAEGINNWNAPAYNENSISTGKVKMVATRPTFTKERRRVLKNNIKSKARL